MTSSTSSISLALISVWKYLRSSRCAETGQAPHLDADLREDTKRHHQITKTSAIAAHERDRQVTGVVLVTTKYKYVVDRGRLRDTTVSDRLEYEL